jgi:ceramide glucosyltransferase
MFYVMRTQTLRDMGGFVPILPFLCDDYALAKLVKAHSGVIRQAVTPQFLRTTVRGPRQYVRLMHRWFVFANVLAGDQRPAVAALLFLFLGLPPFLLWLGALSLFGGPAFVVLVATTLVVRHLALRGLQRTVFGQAPPSSPALSVLAEGLQPLHWLHACLRRTLWWRTRRLRVGRGGRFVHLPSEGS